MKPTTCMAFDAETEVSPDTCCPPEIRRELETLAHRHARRLGMTRRAFLKSQLGTAAWLLAMNRVFGAFFMVDEAEAADPEAAAEGSRSRAGQFIFDVQVHHVHAEYPSPQGLLSLRRAAENWNPRLKGEKQNLADILYENFFDEVFRQSQTTMAVLSNAPDDDKNGWFLSNEQAMDTRNRVNTRLGEKRLFAHALLTPGQPGWMEELDRAIELKPDAWKGYTLGNPGGTSKYPWRLDDEKLVYPAYEKLQKAGFRNICIHKGLLPSGYRQRLSRELIDFAKVDDVGKAAKDWPQLNFIIYHSAIQKVLPGPQDVAQFKKTGRIDWVTNLAEIPEKFGVENVYGELGAVFAGSCVAHPELCAGVLGTLIRGLGDDHVCWGTDSVWFGSPQWQIEALRRIEIPDNMQKQFGFRPLGPADGPVKKAIFGLNSGRLYGLKETT